MVSLDRFKSQVQIFQYINIEKCGISAQGLSQDLETHNWP